MGKVTRVKKNATTSSKNLLLIAVVCSILAVFSGFFVYQYNKVKFYNNLIYPGVSVEGIDVSGKTKKEAKILVEKGYWNKLLDKKVKVEAKGKEYSIKYSDLKAKNNLDKVINDAFSYGKNLIIFKRYSIIKNKPSKNYAIDFDYDKKVLDSLIGNVEKNVNVDPVNASLTPNGGGFSVIPHTNGEKLEKDKLKKDLVNKINKDLSKDICEKASIKVVQPRITSDKLSVINTNIGSFSTQYGGISSPQRANNIVLATNAINGKILMPGDIFSFNNVVGERSAEKGYQAAPVIIGDRVEDGLGGGVCQVSSTLYNVVEKAGLQAVERTHHTKPVHYVPKGKDATVSYGSIDFKFRNNLNYPIYIEGYTNGGSLVFNIYSKG
ncbi:hypothetical protein FDF74_07735 [Clostridium niameyense]|uniref:YoaR-like putative peptidoglycan binding domain-containing protein n=1 Tax=Clostridium niameyense TaxID=1622073 RepID=A0A6M0RBZ6_9CLOT|nr:VanW family protein [Clostridium niameyense]NEZ47099.1 hypothetical protein [Clostridium niameyense]